MTSNGESARSIPKEYADTLIANSRASTQEELGEVADCLIEVTGEMEARGQEIAKLIYELLERV